jgi:hypothetical protein
MLSLGLAVGSSAHAATSKEAIAPSMAASATAPKPVAKPSVQLKSANAKAAPATAANKVGPGAKNMINPQPLPPKVLKTEAAQTAKAAAQGQ